MNLSAEESDLAFVRHQLESLMTARLCGGLDADEQSRYERLCEIESTLMKAAQPGQA